MRRLPRLICDLWCEVGVVSPTPLALLLLSSQQVRARDTSKHDGDGKLPAARSTRAVNVPPRACLTDVGVAQSPTIPCRHER